MRLLRASSDDLAISLAGHLMDEKRGITAHPLSQRPPFTLYPGRPGATLQSHGETSWSIQFVEWKSRNAVYLFISHPQGFVPIADYRFHGVVPWLFGLTMLAKLGEPLDLVAFCAVSPQATRIICASAP